MRPIRDITEVRPNAVLYHSAFGFARVEAVDGGDVLLRWEQGDDNLPTRVSDDNLRRVYALCHQDGFFDRALNRPDALKDLLRVEPPEGLALLLEDLAGPQRMEDLQEWVTGRKLMTAPAFERWWRSLQPLLAEDERFDRTEDLLELRRRAPTGGPLERLENPLLSPARRLDLALAHRNELGDDRFREHAVIALRQGGTQVRDLALKALEQEAADPLLQELIDPGPESVEALIHAIRRGAWEVDDVHLITHDLLVERVVSVRGDDHDLDAEGRLAATLWRWGSPVIVEALARCSGDQGGQTLLRATFDALPPKRAEVLGLAILETSLGQSGIHGARWLTGEILVRAGEDAETMARRIEDDRPMLAGWLRNWRPPAEERLVPLDDATEEEAFQTVEIDPEAFSSPVPVAEVPALPAWRAIGLGLSLARELARHHEAGRIASPHRESVSLRPDGSLSIAADGDPSRSPRPASEAPSPAADVHAAAVLLLEVLLGRPWPRNVQASRGTPLLRHVLSTLPPSAIAPIDEALQPHPERRPADGLAWVTRWQAAAVAEEQRAQAEHDPQARIRIGYDTHVGKMKLLSTQTNQDALYVATRGRQSLLVVCDGISTANAGSGDIASGITAQVVGSLWEQALPRLVESSGGDEARSVLERALRMANQAVCEAALRFAGGRLDGRVPMGTTAILSTVRGNSVDLAWVGDSRAYLVGPYGAALLSADQNQSGSRFAAWAKGDSPDWDAHGYALVGYVGHFNEWGRPEPSPPQLASVVLLPGEWLLLCTDGVTDYLGETSADVCAALAEAVGLGDPDEVARDLVARANRNGGGDNASIVVATLAGE